MVSLDRREHRPDLLNCEGRNDAGPHNCGDHTSTDQYDGEVLRRVTDNVARDFRHILPSQSATTSIKHLSVSAARGAARLDN